MSNYFKMELTLNQIHQYQKNNKFYVCEVCKEQFEFSRDPQEALSEAMENGWEDKTDLCFVCDDCYKNYL